MEHHLKKEEHKTSTEGVGRISKQDSADSSSGSEGQEIRDISHIDQQEGEMKHGSVGGNFQTNDSQDETNNG